MPLMQLSTLVLPAPFGPISASSSPASTWSDTSLSTARPPNRRERCSTASSGIRPLSCRRLPQRAVGTAFVPARLAEIGFLDLAPAAQFGGGAFEDDASRFQHIAVIGDGERHARVLLDQQNRDAKLLSYARYAPRQVLDHDRRQAERQLIDEQQFGLADDGAAEREHLTFAAGEEAGEPRPQLGERREELEDQRFELAALGRIDAMRRGYGEIF